MGAPPAGYTLLGYFAEGCDAHVCILEMFQQWSPD